jgi:hypothetical protein
MAASVLPGHELLSKMNALLNDPTYRLPDDVSETSREWIRTGINMMANELPNPAISVESAVSRTIRQIPMPAPHGGRKSRKSRKQRKQSKQRKQRKQRRKTRSR